MKYEPEDWENYHKGINYFNREKFFEAHEAWEEIWRNTADEEDKRFLQGLIQAAAFLVHVQKGEGTGGDLYGSSVEKLQSFRRGYWGVDVEAFLKTFQTLQERLARQEPLQEFPQLFFLKKPGEEKPFADEIPETWTDEP